MEIVTKNEANVLPVTKGYFKIPGADSPDGNSYLVAPYTRWDMIDGVPGDLNEWKVTEYPLVATSGWKVDSGSCQVYEKGNMRLLRLVCQLTPTQDVSGAVPCVVKPAVPGLADWMYFPMLIGGNYAVSFAFHDGQGTVMLGDRTIAANAGHLQLNSTVIL